MTLLKQRSPEYYINIKSQNQEKKYELVMDQTGSNAADKGVPIRKSLVPGENSGFRGKLLVIKEPQLQKILEARNRLFNHTTDKFSSTLCLDWMTRSHIPVAIGAALLLAGLSMLGAISVGLLASTLMVKYGAAALIITGSGLLLPVLSKTCFAFFQRTRDIDNAGAVYRRSFACV